MPHICISPASPENIPQKLGSNHDDDVYRPKLSTSPYYFSDASPRNPSPLRPADCPPPKGLHRDQSDIPFKVLIDRRAALGSRKLPDLRKELAMKNQRNKHLERRALFLSKIQGPEPSADAYTPKVTPAANHCTLPFPGLQPSLASFEPLAKKDSPRPHVGFAPMDSFLPIGPKVDLESGRHNLPSLDDIIARIGSPRSPPSMLDPILTAPIPHPYIRPRSAEGALPPRSVSNMGLDINIGRLHMPLRRRQSSNSLSDAHLNSMRKFPSIEITPPAVSGTVSNARYALTGLNVHALGRTNTAREMITTIKRRTSPPPSPPRSLERCRPKRHSAPAEMQLRGRSGFEHPNSSLPGSF